MLSVSVYRPHHTHSLHWLLHPSFNWEQLSPVYVHSLNHILFNLEYYHNTLRTQARCTHYSKLLWFYSVTPWCVILFPTNSSPLVHMAVNLLPTQHHPVGICSWYRNHTSVQQYCLTSCLSWQLSLLHVCAALTVGTLLISQVWDFIKLLVLGLCFGAPVPRSGQREWHIFLLIKEYINQGNGLEISLCISYLFSTLVVSTIVVYILV
jgi:hypothetical protein